MSTARQGLFDDRSNLSAGCPAFLICRCVHVCAASRVCLRCAKYLGLQADGRYCRPAQGGPRRVYALEGENARVGRCLPHIHTHDFAARIVCCVCFAQTCILIFVTRNSSDTQASMCNVRYERNFLRRQQSSTWSDAGYYPPQGTYLSSLWTCKPSPHHTEVVLLRRDGGKRPSMMLSGSGTV